MIRAHWHNDWRGRWHDVRWLTLHTDNMGGPALTVMLLGFGVEVTWARKYPKRTPSIAEITTTWGESINAGREKGA